MAVRLHWSGAQPWRSAMRIAGASGLSTSRRMAEEELPRPLKEASGRFMNPWKKNGRDPCEKGFSDIVRLLRDARPPIFQDADSAQLTSPVPVAWDQLRAIRDRKETRPAAVWLGHASVLGIYAGKIFLFDPVFSERCSPFSFVGPKRFTESPVKADLSDWPEDLLPDVVAISHAHYDHLDEATVRQLHQRRPAMRWLVPLGLGSWLASWNVGTVTEMDWWQKVAVDDDLAVVALPAQHWANRWPWDRNTTLWCGFGIVLQSEETVMPLCFLGDTGYCPVFRLLGSKFQIQLAAVPIGAYHPRWFMSGSHCDPSEAVQIVKDLNAASALAIHWGTFPLTAEPCLSQLSELHAARGRLQDGRLRALRPGGHMCLETGGHDLADELVEKAHGATEQKGFPLKVQ